MTQSEKIAKQVALKGAIELTKDKFDVKENITEQLEVIKQISNNLYEHLMPSDSFIDPPSIIADIIPICIAVPPDSTTIPGIMVSTSIKFEAKAKNAECQRKEKKL